MVSRRVISRWVIAAIALASVEIVLRAHDFYSTKITWSMEVSRIVYRHCASCHHAGGSSFPLMSYRETRPWAEAIKQQVLARRMPPWNAVKGFGEFKHEQGLSQQDIAILAEWVAGGAPEGNPLFLPFPPDFRAPATSNAAGVSHAMRIEVSGAMVAKRNLDVVGIEPEQVPATGSMQVVAERPDGSVEPLIWVERFNPGYRGIYYFQNTLHLRPGTKIEITPPEGVVALVVKER